MKCLHCGDGCLRMSPKTTDKQRLDWLQKTQTNLYRCTHEETHPLTDGSNGYETRVVFDGWCAGTLGEESMDIREAIDSAMGVDK